jgi:hypothetical protein
MSRSHERSAERVRVDAFVKVQDEGHELVFRTRDLSAHGLFLYTQVARAYPIRVGSTLRLELSENDDQVVCRVVVVRVVEEGSVEATTYPVGFGVRIVEISDEDRAGLARIIDRTRRAAS